MSDNINSFGWKDINGKILEIKVSEDIEGDTKVTAIMGRAVNTSDIYLLRTIAEKVTP